MSKKKETKKGDTNKIVNFYDHPVVKKLNPTFDDDCYQNVGIKYNSKVIVVGSTGSGKTTFLLNYLARCPLRYGHITVCNSGMSEPLYEFLEKRIGADKITFYTYSKLPNLNELGNKGVPQLLIADDLVAIKKQEKLESYAIRCRKHGMGVSFFYLTQKYYAVPIIIRAQAQYLIIIKVADMQDLKRILKQSDMGISINQLIQMYEMATSEPFCFLKVDLGCSDINKKFSKNFLDYFTINSDGTVSL